MGRLASAHLSLNHLDQALAAFDRLVALTPEDAEAWAGRAKVIFDLSRRSDATACYDCVLVLDPDYEHIKGQRVSARLQAADWDGSRVQSGLLPASFTVGALV